MANCGIKMLVISFSATVCGGPQFLPLTDTSAIGNQPLWGHQAGCRGDIARRVSFRPILAYRYPALLQSGGGAQAEAFD